MSRKINVGNSAIVATSDSTARYIQDIRKFAVLSKAEELELLSNKTPENIEKVVKANLKFVTQVAVKYQGMGLLLEDLIAFGRIGLFTAAEKFDSERGFKFITFAIWYIRAEINAALNDLSRVVRIPSHLTKTESISVISTQSAVGDDENKETYADRYLQGESEKMDHDVSDMKMLLSAALNKLKPKQKEAVMRFYGIGFEYSQSMDQIAEEMDITGERARQLVRQAETELKSLPGIKQLKQYA
jgi:RNA polymerase primary sigma factor